MAKEVKDKKSKSEKKNFFKEFKAELKRVSWPTFKQLVNNTTAVLAIVILLAVIVFVLDVIFENLNNFGVEKLKALVTSSSSETVDNNENEEQNNDVANPNEAGETNNQENDNTSDTVNTENNTDAGSAETENNNPENTNPEAPVATPETSVENNSSVENN